jgi:hypothetical protein
MLRLDTARNVITARQVVVQNSRFIYQMCEWVRFPNGDLAVYFDVQTLGHDGRNFRAGMRENRSHDGCAHQPTGEHSAGLAAGSCRNSTGEDLVHPLGEVLQPNGIFESFGSKLLGDHPAGVSNFA